MKESLNAIGMPKSGKPWKKLSKRANVINTFKKETYQQRLERYARDKALRQKVKEIRDEKNHQKELQRLKHEDKVKRQKTNDLKGLVVQEVFFL